MKIMNGSTHNGSFGTGDVIEEFLRENEPVNRRLPGPPPPPPMELDELLTITPLSGRTPKLVSRCTDSQHHTMFPSGNTSTFPSSRGSKGQRRGTAQVPVPRIRTHHTDTEQLEQLLDKPTLKVVEQPKERGMRFRYECEGRSAGSILGASSTDVNKTLPAIELHGPIEGIQNVTVTVSLVTKDIPHRPHPHCLVGKDCTDGICLISFNPHITRRHSFVNLGVQCVRRKELDASLMRRKKKNIDPFNTGHSKSIEDMDMNVVRLCFQCELERDDGDRIHLGPVVSNPIYDKKATTTAELKINRLNIVKGPCNGKTEIYMLCDKVQKEDIEIIFSLGSWEAKAEFAHTDVHRQIAIIFKSPPYQEQDISEEVEVNVCLRRISDRMNSEPVQFTYLPDNPDPYEVKRKLKLKADKFNTDCSISSDAIGSTPGLSHQLDPFSFGNLNCNISAPEVNQSTQAQLPEFIQYDDDLKEEDSCVSLDQDTLSSILANITECLGPQNFLQLLNSQDLNSNFTDLNMNPQDVSQPSANAAALNDLYMNPEIPQDMHIQDVFLRQVKTENEEES
ncbi:transcription factor RelB [Trichomycterus rosablanca]|uniref:transcription factor RelB n=1 Tax=Trichomycterus rosablanca TaxID=2290929 RepID=UPI002F35786D